MYTTQVYVSWKAAQRAQLEAVGKAKTATLGRLVGLVKQETGLLIVAMIMLAISTSAFHILDSGLRSARKTGRGLRADSDAHCNLSSDITSVTAGRWNHWRLDVCGSQCDG